MPRTTTSYAISGTESFRLGSRKLLGIYGGNLQNIPKELRKIFVPDEGKIFVQVDQAGAEALIVAYLCKAGNYRDLFTYGVKPHVYVALHCFSEVWKKHIPTIVVEESLKTPIKHLKNIKGWKDLDTIIKSSDGWSAQERYYYIAKMICHASNYGMKAPTFALNVIQKSDGQINMSVKAATVLLNDYHRMFPEIQEWHRAIQKELKERGLLRNLFGYPRQFFRPLNDKTFKEAYAFKPQSTVATITNIAITETQELIEQEKLDSWDVLQNGHDSMLGQVPIGEESAFAWWAASRLNRELVNDWGEKFTMKSEAKCGMNWGDSSENNPDGLREL